MHGNESSTEIPLVAIVDDDASMRNSTRRLIRLFVRIQSGGFCVGREFLDSGCPTETACLILDVRMPSMDGLELQRLLANANYRIPIILGLAQQRYAKSRRIFANSRGVKDFRRFRNSQDGTCFHP